MLCAGHTTGCHYIQALFNSGCAPRTTVSYAWPQTSATKQMRTAFFWVIMQWVMVICYQCFEISYQSHLYESRIQKSRWDQSVVPKCRKEITATCCIVTQKNAVLNCFFSFSSHLTENTHCLDLKNCLSNLSSYLTETTFSHKLYR